MKKTSELKDKILDYFLAHGQLTAAEASQLRLEVDFVKLEQALVKAQNLTEEDITKAKAVIFNLPYTTLGDERVPVSILNIFPKEDCYARI